MLKQMFRKVIEVEAPITQDLLFRCVADAWGIGRIATRIRASMLTVLKAFLGQNPER